MWPPDDTSLEGLQKMNATVNQDDVARDRDSESRELLLNSELKYFVRHVVSTSTALCYPRRKG